MQTAHHFQPPVSDKLGFVCIGDDAISLFSHGTLGTNFLFGLKWPRHIYGRAVRELKVQGATAVGLDILFDGRRLDHGPESDLFLAEQLKQAANVVIGATKQVAPDKLFSDAASALGELSHERDSDGVLRRDYAFRDYRIWHSAIQQEAALRGWDLANSIVESNRIIFARVPASNLESAGQGNGPTVLSLNPDGYFDPTDLSRDKTASGFVRLFKPFEQVRVWHLGIVLAARELNLDLEKASVQLENGEITLPGPKGLRRVLPVDRHGQFLIDWTVQLTDPRLAKDSFERLIANDILRQHGEQIAPVFAGKLVVIGSTATGNELTDRGATPLEKDAFLTSNYWNVVNSLLTNRFIQQSACGTDLLLIGLLGLSAGFLTWKLRAIWASFLVGVLVLGWVLLALFLFVRFRWWVPMILPGGVALLTHFALLTYQTFFEQNERRRVRTIFAKLVSPNVVHELLKAPKLSLVGARGQVTVFFADVRGFTELTDRSHAQAEEYVRAHQLGPADAKMYFDQQAQDVLNTVNLYLGSIADIIKKHDGTLDKYIGDCVMAFWGAPTPHARHALACVRAAIEAQRAIHALNQTRLGQNKFRERDNVRRIAAGWAPLPPLELLSLGTGINTGIVTVGLMGSDAHGLNYTVFGRDVNLASRLENHSGRGRILVSEATYLELQRDSPTLASTCIPLPPTKFKGFGSDVKIFEVPWRPTEIKVTAEPVEAFVPAVVNG